MTYRPLTQSFFIRDTQLVARELLGKLLVRTWRNKEIIGRITEVECYIGKHDAASHASKGKTKRTEVMFGPAGRAYVYLVYGMYHCFNVVTEKKNFPAAILIRAVTPMTPVANKTDGPGKLCREFHITRALNKHDLTQHGKLYIADDKMPVSKHTITQTPRIGVGYAGEDALLPWRYLIKN